MGSSANILILAASMCALVYVIEAASSNCPLPSKMYSCKPTCREDRDCKGQVCCPNLCNTKSCTSPDSSGKNKYSQSYGNSYSSQKEIMSGPGSYCGPVKCSSYEKCIKDPVTGKLVCSRA